jgi:hypothetical protein
LQPRKSFDVGGKPDPTEVRLKPDTTYESCPARRLRSEIRERLRSVHQIHATAATMPPTAPPASEVPETCRVSVVVPTASTHHDRRPAIKSDA